MKHAFLIMAHGNWDVLLSLVNKLDNEANDIYLHVDKKVHLPEKVKSQLLEVVRSSDLYFAKRIRINWGAIARLNARCGYSKWHSQKRDIAISTS